MFIGQGNWKYYLYEALNAALTILIFIVLYLIAAKVFKNITSLLNILI
jgi:hypothetical protein